MIRRALKTELKHVNVRKAAMAAATSVAALFTASWSSAQAADLGGGRNAGYPAAVEPRTNIERWTGFYLGAALGGSASRTAMDGDFGIDRASAKGWDASLLAGYNWQAGRMVFGLETDIGKTNLKSSRTNGLDSYTTDFNTLGAVRARAGFLVSPSFMVYATGGFAYAHSQISLDRVGGETSKQWFTGWQAGLGTELKIDPRWSLRLEYLYTDLAAQTITHSGVTNTFDPSLHTVRAGLTFKF